MAEFKVQVDEKLLNSILKQIPEQKLEYRHGCFLGAAKLPVGAVKAVVIPSFNGSYVVFAVPFKEIKGDLTGKFFLSKLISVFWGTISKQAEKVALPVLRKYGMGADTLVIEKVKEAGGEVGKIKVSVNAINRWLEAQHPRLSPNLTGLIFSSEGVEVVGDLRVVA
ncbi:MAG: hypothetical protein WC314_20225 [Vulcanimicrobiota bacterium]